jgi:hypothetical protein
MFTQASCPDVMSEPLDRLTRPRVHSGRKHVYDAAEMMAGIVRRRIMM